MGMPGDFDPEEPPFDLSRFMNLSPEEQAKMRQFFQDVERRSQDVDLTFGEKMKRAKEKLERLRRRKPGSLDDVQ